MPRTRGPFGRRDLPAARAFLDSVYSSAGTRRGRGAKSPAELSDAQVVRYANSLRRQAAEGRPLSLTEARRGRVLVRKGTEAGTYVPAPERRKPREIGTWGQGIEFASAAALIAYLHRNVPPGPAQVTAYGKPAESYQIPEYLRAQLATGPTGRTWRTILTVYDWTAEPALATAAGLIAESSRVGITDVAAWELRWQL